MPEGTKAVQCVTALNAFSGTPDGTEVLPELETDGPTAALSKLAALLADGEGEAASLPPVVVLDALVKFAARKGISAHRDEIALVLMALLAEAEDPHEADTGTVLDALATVAGLPDETSSADTWRAFVAEAGEALPLPAPEVERPQCNDIGEVTKEQKDVDGVVRPFTARCVTVVFYVDFAPGKMLKFCEPTEWHELSPFQQPMTLIDEAGDELRSDSWWRHDLTETVELFPGVPLKTPLRFSHSIDEAEDPAWVHLDYVQISDTTAIHIDEGELDVRRMTDGPQRGRTRVSAKKAICFDDEMFQNWTTIACDTFWTDTVIAAAVKGAGDGE